MSLSNIEKYDSLNHEVANRKETGLIVPSTAEAARNHLFSLLTPESMKRELVNIMYKLTINQSAVDPRINNNPLPNDACITKKYGHTAFTSDCYPGFVWHLGFWYKESATLKFLDLSPDENDKLLAIPLEHRQTTLLKEGLLDMTIRMDSAFYPAKINGNRVFLREYWEIVKFDSPQFTYMGYNQNTLDKSKFNASDTRYKYVDTIMYIPELQGCQTALIHRFSNHAQFFIEDTDYYSYLPKSLHFVYNEATQTKTELR